MIVRLGGLVVVVAVLAGLTLVAPATAGCPAGTTDPNYCTPSAPAATTTAATNITSTSATLNGSVIPNGLATTYHFEYGTGAANNLNQSTANGNAGSDYTSHDESAAITGLTPCTSYNFRIVASNADGTTNGSTLTFTTTGCAGGGGGGGVGVGVGVPTPTPTPGTSTPPSVTTLAATDVAIDSATLNGSVNPEGQATNDAFQYGTSTGYGLRTPTTQVQSTRAAATDDSDHPVSATVTGLSPGTTYHYRVVAQNAAGLATGQDLTFTTARATNKRKKPRLTLRATPHRDPTKPFRYKAKGRLIRPKGVSAKAGCTGTVTVKIRRFKLHILGQHTTRLHGNCRYSTHVTVTHRPAVVRGRGAKEGNLNVRAYFFGNRVLSKAHSIKRHLIYGPRQRGDR